METATDVSVSPDDIPKLLKKHGFGFIWTEYPKKFSYTLNQGRKKRKARILLADRGRLIVGLAEDEMIIIALLSEEIGLPQGRSTMQDYAPYIHVWYW